jgi:hypothetical protein
MAKPEEIEALARAMRAHARKLEDLKDAQEDLERRLAALKSETPAKPGKGDGDGEGDGNPF